MPRPTTKAELLSQAIDNYETLRNEIADLTKEELVEPGIVGEWSIKDVLAHLMVWQQMTLSWYRAGQRGETPITPSEHYTWQQIPALNQRIYESYRDAKLTKIKRDFAHSHNETIKCIELMTEDELFQHSYYSWTKSTTLGSYLTSATSSHYVWARTEIRRGLKTREKRAS